MFQAKQDCNYPILKYKARWIAYGFKQEASIDFVETFVPTVKLMLYKYLFEVSVKRNDEIQ